MKRRASVFTTVITTGTVLTSLPVFAHSGHVEEKSDTTESTSAPQNGASSSSHRDNQPEETPSQSSSTQQNATSSSPSSNTNQSSTENNHHEETQAVEAQPTTQAQVLTIGKIPALGETIFSLMLAAPFLLYAARKRIHQS